MNHHIERLITACLIGHALDQGCTISVHDGEDGHDVAAVWAEAV
jgi:hypothetical protein